jgi:hypothetical protein
MGDMEFGKGKENCLIRTFSGTFLWGICGRSLFIAMQYRKLERELYIVER